MAAEAVYTAVDIETTGLEVYNADILEIAAVRFEAGRPTGERFVQLARPRIQIPREATAIHGLTDRDVAHAPPIRDTMSGLVEFLQGELLVCHNAGFDVPFLARELRSQGLSAEAEVADTIPLARGALSLGSYSLGPVCEELGVQVAARHRAEGDAMATGEAFWRLLKRAGGDPRGRLRALQGTLRLKPMSFEDLATVRAVAMTVECPPGTDVQIHYATPGCTPRWRRLTVEFYSRTRNQAYLTGRIDSRGGERRVYRLDRVLRWRVAG